MEVHAPIENGPQPPVLVEQNVNNDPQGKQPLHEEEKPKDKPKVLVIEVDDDKEDEIKKPPSYSVPEPMKNFPAYGGPPCLLT